MWSARWNQWAQTSGRQKQILWGNESKKTIFSRTNTNNWMSSSSIAVIIIIISLFWTVPCTCGLVPKKGICESENTKWQKLNLARGHHQHPTYHPIQACVQGVQTPPIILHFLPKSRLRIQKPSSSNVCATLYTFSQVPHSDLGFKLTIDQRPVELNYCSAT